MPPQNPTTESDGLVRLAISGAVATITLNRLEKAKRVERRDVRGLPRAIDASRRSPEFERAITERQRVR